MCSFPKALVSFTMGDVLKNIEEIEAEMARRPAKNKANSFQQGILKAKLAKLSREVIKSQGGSAKDKRGQEPH